MRMQNIPGIISQHNYTAAACIGFTLLALSGCATQAPPTQEMSDARQSIEAAQSAGLTSPELDSAAQLLNDASQGLREGDFDQAQKDAVAAREAAHTALAANAELITPESILVTSEPKAPQIVSYTVSKGDNLWSLASRKEFYGDAKLWPLILKANADHIDNADLLRPGQVITIKLDPSPEEASEAYEHTTKRRLDWPRAKRLAVDKAFLQDYGLR